MKRVLVLFTALLSPRLWTLVAAIVLTLEVPSMCEAGETPRRLFLDDYHIQSTTGLSRVYHQPVKHTVPVIMPDKPWEMGPTYGRFLNMIKGVEWSPTLGRYRMWYNAGDYWMPCYAESADGLTWTKPVLNLSGTNFDGSGSKSNNIIDLGYAPQYTDDQALVIIRDDLDPDTNRRYKAVVRREPENTMRLLFSSDGLRWKWSGNTSFKNSDCYSLLHDTLTGRYVFFGKVVDGDGHRNVTMATSVNFKTWSANPLYFEADATDQTLGNTRKAQWLSDTNRVQPTYINAQAWTDIYIMPAFIYEGLYLALPSIDDWTGSASTQDGVLYPELMVSRDLAGPWNRLDRSPFINVSMKNATNLYDQGMILSAQPVRVGDELWFYYIGYVHTHAQFQSHGTDYLRSAIHLAKLRLDGFASLRAGATAGSVVTKSLPVSGKSLYVNAAAQAGTLKAELLDADTGTAIPGYTLADSVALQADAVRAKLQWQGVTDLSALAGRSVRIRFSVQNADLYSFWFEEPVTTDLAVWWKFDETNGTSAADSSGSGNAGTLTNMGGTEWTAGKLNNSLNFDGVNDYVVRNTLSANITGDCTVSVWMNRSGVPSTNVRLMDLATAGGSGMQLVVRGTTGYAGMDDAGGLTVEIAGTQNLCDGSWHHVAAVRTGTTFRLYVDGALAVSNSNPTNTAPTFTRLAVAAFIGGGNPFPGKLDDVRVYSRALSGTEIQALSDSGQAAPVNIGGRLELFVDKHLIQTLSNATLRLHQPVDKGAVFSLDAPWEGSHSAYQSVVKDGNRFHLYGRGYRRLAAGTFAFPAVTSFRMSSDGITWEMPSVGLHAFNGSTDNSIIWTNNSLDMGSGYSECFIVSMNANPNALAQEKFIALAHRGDSGTHSIFTSPDGATFTMKPNPVKVEPGDAGGDLVFWDSNLGQYAAYMRAWYNPTTGQALGYDGGYNGGPLHYRWVWRKLSPDLTNWSALVLMSFRDASGNPAPAEHYYTFSNEQYFRAPHLYIAMPSRFMETRKAVPKFYLDGVNDGVFLTSRDGVVWDRTFMEAFIRPGTDRLNWTSRAVYPVRGVVQTGTNELSVYWIERKNHGDVAPRIRRGTLRLDGFASVRAGAAGGEMITKPLTFTGSRLVLNHVTAPAGSVRVEIQDANGTPIPGYALANSTARTGDTLEETMSWTGGSDLSALAGTTIRLRFVLQDSDVCTMRFTN